MKSTSRLDSKRIYTRGVIDLGHGYIVAINLSSPEIVYVVVVAPALHQIKNL